jgi:hypothetical protein
MVCPGVKVPDPNPIATVTFWPAPTSVCVARNPSSVRSMVHVSVEFRYPQ